MAKLDKLNSVQIHNAEKKARGRSLSNSDFLEITDYGDEIRADYWWNDGACVSYFHDTMQDAKEQAARHGYKQQKLSK